MRKNILVLGVFLLFLSNFAKAQDEYKNVAGFYQFSKMEYGSSTVLLEDKRFLFTAVYGSANPFIWGKYEIKDGKVFFKPSRLLLNNFMAYGIKTKGKPKDKITVIALYCRNRTNTPVFLKSGIKFKKLPKIDYKKRYVNIELDRPKNGRLVVLNAKRTWDEFVLEDINFQIPKDINEIVLIHQADALMAKDIAKRPIKIGEESLNIKNRQAITQKLKDKIKNVIEKKEQNLLNYRGLKALRILDINKTQKDLDNDEKFIKKILKEHIN